jgi:hypothetical protein
MTPKNDQKIEKMTKTDLAGKCRKMTKNDVQNDRLGGFFDPLLPKTGKMAPK